MDRIESYRPLSKRIILGYTFAGHPTFQHCLSSQSLNYKLSRRTTTYTGRDAYLISLFRTYQCIMIIGRRHDRRHDV
eukprot:scaffold5055_cov210-Alexandrium_tamarense.AAC.10